MSKYTPGPWRLSSECPNIIKQDFTHIGLSDSSGYLIASSMGHDNSGFYASVEEGLANARLIAAAPDLLSSNERLLNNFRALLSGRPVRDAEETISEAEKAIAKANGETL